jgi:predicted cobalt transporter CbtA
MPKFLITVIAVVLASAGGLAYLVFFTSPENKILLALFFILSFIFLSHLISIPTYFYLYKNAPRMTELKALYRNSYKISAFFSSFVVFIAVLRTFHAFNALNLLLLCVLYFSIYKFFGKKEGL